MATVVSAKGLRRDRLGLQRRGEADPRHHSPAHRPDPFSRPGQSPPLPPDIELVEIPSATPSALAPASPAPAPWPASPP